VEAGCQIPFVVSENWSVEVELFASTEIVQTEEIVAYLCGSTWEIRKEVTKEA
jgi:hypothetical protein